MGGEIFKAYDIRGIFPTQLDKSLAYKIGRAFVVFTKAKQVLVGRDARSSSPALFKALARGITMQGAELIDIGLCSTPLFYFASRNSPASIMVTASHNPKQYNGFKLCREKALPISWDDGIKEIQNLVEKNQFFKVSTTGKIITKDIRPGFIRHNLEFLRKQKKLKIVLDAGNGMGGYILPLIFKKIKTVDFIPLHCKVDLSFPNHEANPLNWATLQDLQEKVRQENADLGIATDGDGDRCIFVDEQGEIISSDLTVALIAQELLARNKGAIIIYDVRCSQIVKETIEKAGGQALLSRVGHSFIKKLMREKEALFAGELSGHLYYRENNYSESVFISAALIMNLLSSKGVSLSTLVRPLRKYFSSGEINTAVKDKDKKIKDIEKHYKEKAQEILNLDGLSMYFKGWWFNLRKSNTESLLRLNLEADSKELMEEKREEILRLLV